VANKQHVSNAAKSCALIAVNVMSAELTFVV
jgi:hypothetical protein